MYPIKTLLCRTSLRHGLMLSAILGMLGGCETAQQTQGSAPEASTSAAAQIAVPRKMGDALDNIAFSFREAKMDTLTYMKGEGTAAGVGSKSIARMRDAGTRLSSADNMFHFCVKQEGAGFSYVAHQRMPARTGTALTEGSDSVVLGLARSLSGKAVDSRETAEDSKNRYAAQLYQIDNVKLVCGVVREKE